MGRALALNLQCLGPPPTSCDLGQITELCKPEILRLDVGILVAAPRGRQSSEAEVNRRSEHCLPGAGHPRSVQPKEGATLGFLAGAEKLGFVTLSPRLYLIK